MKCPSTPSGQIGSKFSDSISAAEAHLYFIFETKKMVLLICALSSWLSCDDSCLSHASDIEIHLSVTHAQTPVSPLSPSRGCADDDDGGNHNIQPRSGRISPLSSPPFSDLFTIKKN
jgi:hypothetical protein